MRASEVVGVLVVRMLQPRAMLGVRTCEQTSHRRRRWDVALASDGWICEPHKSLGGKRPPLGRTLGLVVSIGAVNDKNCDETSCRAVALAVALRVVHKNAPETRDTWMQVSAALHFSTSDELRSRVM